MCNEAVDSYPSAIQFVIDWYKTQEMRNKEVDTCLSSGSVPDQLQLMKYVIKMFPKVDKVLLVTNKMLKKLDHAVFSNAEIFFFNAESHFLVMIWVFIM